MPLIVFLVKFVFIFVADFKSIFMPFTTLPFFSHPVKQNVFSLETHLSNKNRVSGTPITILCFE